MEMFRDIPAVAARDRKEWRRWLEKNHTKESRVWLIMYHKNSDVSSVHYDEAVEEALCFGWIDSIVQKRDAVSKYQYFSQRKVKSNWSRSNKGRVERLIAEKLMRPAGQKMVDIAKETGTWDALTRVQNSVIPSDLEKLLKKNKTALKNFEAFPPSSKRIILEWIMNAKRPETRKKRIEETVGLAAQNIRANHYSR